MRSATDGAAAVLLLAALLSGAAGTARAWTDDPLVAGTTPIRKVHVDELRSAAAAKLSDFGFAAPSWTDASITAGSTLIRAVHITEIQSKLGTITAAYHGACPGTVPATPAWDSVTAGVSLIRAADVVQLRSTSDSIGSCASCCSGVCQTGACSGASGCVARPDATQLAGCTGDTGTGNCQYMACDGAGSCSAHNYPSGTEGTCPVCQDCNGAGACGNVAGGQADAGCNGGVATCSNADACNGAGGCNLNHLASGSEGNEGGAAACSTCYDCNGSGGCAAVANGTSDVGCNAAGGTCASAQTCNGAGGCNENFYASGTQAAGCGTCKQCSGAERGTCTQNTANGAAGIGCNGGVATCSNADTCNGSGGCNLNHLPSGYEGSEGGAAACSTCYDCNGSGSCAAVSNGVNDVGCSGAFCSGNAVYNYVCNGSGGCGSAYATTCSAAVAYGAPYSNFQPTCYCVNAWTIRCPQGCSGGSCPTVDWDCSQMVMDMSGCPGTGCYYYAGYGYYCG